MNEVTILHQKAMEFADEARLAKMEGKKNVAQGFFEKAYALEVEAVQKLESDDESKGILARSAAALAIDAKRFDAAYQLLYSTKRYALPAYLFDEIQQLEESLATYFTAGEMIEIKGKITYANADKNLIKIQVTEGNDMSYTIFIPDNQINEIVKSYWADTVIINGKKDAAGIIMLSKIDKAA